MEEPFYLKFTYPTEETFQSAEKVFEVFCRCKESNEWPEDVDYWRPVFGEEAMSKFWWPSPEEIKRWQKLYLAVGQRWLCYDVITLILSLAKAMPQS